MSDAEQKEAAEEARKAAELAHSNIQRFLALQRDREGALIMKAHEQQLQSAAQAAGAAAELAGLNIKRFLELQAGREFSLIMRAHETSTESTKGRKG
jgi:hypothetical protein